MKEPKMVLVSIYCKIFTDCFSRDMSNRIATGQEIYDFLMKDAGCCLDGKGKIVLGDCNLWYLGCNEKFGVLQYKEIVMEWSFGESSFDRVECFVTMLFLNGLVAEEQYRNLMLKILEGRQIDNMYDIKKYLLAKGEGRPWAKTKEAYKFRGEIKEYVRRVEKHFQQEGLMLYPQAVH